MKARACQAVPSDPGPILNASAGQALARVVPDILVERSAADATAHLAIDAKYKEYDERFMRVFVSCR
jgi:hypothetical protein